MHDDDGGEFRAVGERGGFCVREESWLERKKEREREMEERDWMDEWDGEGKGAGAAAGTKDIWEAFWGSWVVG